MILFPAHLKSNDLVKPSSVTSVIKSMLLICVLAFIGSCSVISQEVRDEAIPQVPFKILLDDPDKYKGDTVILGGYILETKILAEETAIKVLQTPLGFRQEPESKDESQGRILLFQKGFLDPEVYAKDRRITVAGKVLGSVAEETENVTQKYLKIQSREIHLWSREDRYDVWPRFSIGVGIGFISLFIFGFAIMSFSRTRE